MVTVRHNPEAIFYAESISTTDLKALISFYQRPAYYTFVSASETTPLGEATVRPLAMEPVIATARPPAMAHRLWKEDLSAMVSLAALVSPAATAHPQKYQSRARVPQTG